MPAGLDFRPRPTPSPQSIAEQSAGVVVPGNLDSSAADRAARVDELFEPYQRTIAAILDARAPVLDARAARPTSLLAIHSFTPNMPGQDRPWPISVAYGRDRTLAAALIAGLAKTGDFDAATWAGRLAVAIRGLVNPS